MLSGPLKKQFVPRSGNPVKMQGVISLSSKWLLYRQTKWLLHKTHRISYKLSSRFVPTPGFKPVCLRSSL